MRLNGNTGPIGWIQINVAEPNYVLFIIKRTSKGSFILILCLIPETSRADISPCDCSCFLFIYCSSVCSCESMHNLVLCRAEVMLIINACACGLVQLVGRFRQFIQLPHSIKTHPAASPPDPARWSDGAGAVAMVQVSHTALTEHEVTAVLCLSASTNLKAVLTSLSNSQPTASTNPTGSCCMYAQWICRARHADSRNLIYFSSGNSNIDDIQ